MRDYEIPPRRESSQGYEFCAPGARIVVVGVTGSGKTTTAARLSCLLGIPHVELDALHWLPNWKAADREVFRQRVSEALSGASWVVDGNYGKTRDIIWGRADTLVWLDYSLPVVLAQLFWRTMQRIITREELWGSNRETIRGTFFSRDSLFLWALQTYPQHRRTYPELLASPEYTHLQRFHFHGRGETVRWLNWLGGQQAYTRRSEQG